jgi:cardiolipin synthase
MTTATRPCTAASLDRTPPVAVPGVALTSLWGRDAEWQRRLAMVRAARRFLYASTYFYQYDRYGIAYARELLAARRHGVSVWLVIDRFGQQLARTLMTAREQQELERLFAALRDAGVHLQLYHPPGLLQRLVGGGLHIKVQVSEAGEAILTSGNISATSFAQWHEYAVVVRGRLAAELLATLMEAIDRPERADLAVLRRQSRRDAVPDTTYCVAHYPCADPSPLSPFVQSRWNPVTRELVRLIDGAQSRVRITTFYFKPAPELFRALERAALRGVEIEIHHSHRDALTPSDGPWISTTFYYRRCLALGMALHENRRGEHSKIVLVDDRWAAFGTYNLEHAADDRLAEVMVVTGDAAIVGDLHRALDRLRYDPANHRVDPGRLARLPLSVKAKRLALYPLRRWV